MKGSKLSEKSAFTHLSLLNAHLFIWLWAKNFVVKHILKQKKQSTHNVKQILKDYLVDSTEGRHIHSLPPDGTSTSDTSGVLTGSAVDDGIHQDLEGILGKKFK